MQRPLKIHSVYSQHQSSIQHFPNELFFEVFIYLLPEDLFRAFGNLNARFHALSRSTFINFQINKDNIHLLSVIEASQLKSIMINDLFNFQMVMNYFQENHFIQLKRLEFTFVELQSMRTFIEIIPKFDHLKFLRINSQLLSKCDESNAFYQTIAGLLFTPPFFTQLESIEFLIPDMTPYYGCLLRPNPLSILRYFSISSICLDDLTIILTWMSQIKWIKIVYAFIINDEVIDQLDEHDLISRLLIQMPAITSIGRLDIGLCHGVTCKHMKLLLKKLPGLRQFHCLVWSEYSLYIEPWIQIFMRSKIDRLCLTLITQKQQMYEYLLLGLTANIWHHQIFNTANFEIVFGGMCLKAYGLNEARIKAAKELDDQSSDEHQTKKQRIN